MDSSPIRLAEKFIDISDTTQVVAQISDTGIATAGNGPAEYRGAGSRYSVYAGDTGTKYGGICSKIPPQLA